MLFERLLVLFGLWAATAWAKSHVTINVKIRPRGKYAFAEITYPAVRCDWSPRAFSYIFQVCSEQGACFSEKAPMLLLPRGTHELSKPLKFWTTYTARLIVGCFGEFYEATKRQFNTGPGVLEPLTDILVEPRDHEATVAWHEQNKTISHGTHVVLELCKKNLDTVRDCVKRRVDKTEEEFTFENLVPGLEYVVRAYLDRDYNGTVYTSPSISKTFHCDPPRERDYPPISKIAHKIFPSIGETVKVTINYTKPTKSRESSEFWGVAVLLRNLHGKEVASEQRTRNTSVTFSNLPLFLHITAHVNALYSVRGEIILSKETTYKFFTGSGGFPTPTIRQIRAVSDSEALVEWNHLTSDASDEFIYIVRYGLAEATPVGGALLIKSNFSSYALIGGLKPQTIYSVTVIAAINVDGKMINKTSDSQTVRTLRDGALNAVIEHDPPVTAEGIHISWNVVLPEDATNCSFTAFACHTECKYINSIAHDVRELTLPFYPFEMNKVKVVTECLYFDNIKVTRRPPFIEVFADFDLAPPSELSGHALSTTALHISYEFPEYEKQHSPRFLISWLSMNDTTETQWSGARTWKLYYNIQNLSPYTTYNISVAIDAHRRDDTTIMRKGIPAYIQLTTEFPAPPPVNNLRVVQVPLTSTLLIEWSPPLYEYTNLIYNVEATCGESRGRPLLTKNTSANMTVVAHNEETCVVSVSPTNDVQPPAVPKNGTQNTVTLAFIGIARPRDITLTKRTPMSLWLSVTPPDASAESNVTNATTPDDNVAYSYKLALDGASYSSRAQTSANFSLSFLRPYTNYTVKACVCRQDLCGDSLVRSFTTNVIGPSSVRELMLTGTNDSIAAEWKPPVRSNGPLDGYFVTVRDVEDVTSMMMNYTLGGRNTSMQISLVNEYTLYDVTIQAFNFDLDHNDTEHMALGPSTLQRVQTHGTHPRPVKHLRANAIVDRAINLVWERDEESITSHVTWYRLVIRQQVIAQNRNIEPGQKRPQLTPNDDVDDGGSARPSRQDSVEKDAEDNRGINAEDNGINAEEDERFTTSPDYTISSLKPYSMYTISVASCSARNVTTCGRPRTISVQTLPSYPSVPRSLRVDTQSSDNVNITWEPPLDFAGPLDGYSVGVAPKGIYPKNWIYLERNATSFVVTNLNEVKEYEIYLCAFNFETDRHTQLLSDFAKVSVVTAAGAGVVIWSIIVACAVFVGIVVVGVSMLVAFRRRASHAATLLGSMSVWHSSESDNRPIVHLEVQSLSENGIQDGGSLIE